MNQSLGHIKSQTLQQGRPKRPASAKRAAQLFPTSSVNQRSVGGTIQQQQQHPPHSQAYNPGIGGSPLAGLMVEGKTKRPSYVQKGGGAGAYAGLASGGGPAARAKSSMSTDQTPPTNASMKGHTASSLSKANPSSVGHSRHGKNLRTLSDHQSHSSNFVGGETSAGAAQPSSMQSTQDRALHPAGAVSTDRLGLSRKSTADNRHSDPMLDQDGLGSQSMTPQRLTG